MTEFLISIVAAAAAAVIFALYRSRSGEALSVSFLKGALIVFNPLAMLALLIWAYGVACIEPKTMLSASGFLKAGLVAYVLFSSPSVLWAYEYGVKKGEAALTHLRFACLLPAAFAAFLLFGAPSLLWPAFPDIFRSGFLPVFVAAAALEALFLLVTFSRQFRPSR